MEPVLSMSFPINKLSEMAHANAVKKGFYEKPTELGTRLMLITSELSEALEADRKDRYANILAFEKRFEEICASMPNPTDELKQEAFIKLFEAQIKDTFEDETADATIRILDLAGFKKMDLEKHIYYKMMYNGYREHLHGKKY